MNDSPKETLRDREITLAAQRPARQLAERSIRADLQSTMKIPLVESVEDVLFGFTLARRFARGEATPTIF